jgi:molybdopterin converting factor small subunit
MPATLFLPAILAKLADAKQFEVTGATVGDLVADAATRFPALGTRLRDTNGEPYAFVTFYLNDEDIRFHGGFTATVNDGDELTVVPAIAGG